MNQNYILLLLIILVILMSVMYNNQLEAFTLMKQALLGYEGITTNSSPPWTAATEDLDEATLVAKQILGEINKKTGSKLILGKMDQIQVNTTEKGTQYNLDLFAVNKTNGASDYTVRIIMIFTVDNKKNVVVNTINRSNAMKYPESDIGDRENTDDLILTDENLGDSMGHGVYNISGMPNSILEFSKYKGSTSKTTPNPAEFKKWILPDDKNISCVGKCANKPFDPSKNLDNHIGNEDGWLFEHTMGITSFPHGGNFS